jgi:hypothetical protein
VRCSMGHISPSRGLMGIVGGDITSVISEGPLVGASASPGGPTGRPSGVGGGKAKKAKHPKGVRFSKSEAVFPPCRYIDRRSGECSTPICPQRWSYQALAPCPSLPL